ncbi:hypothetical protein JCM13664_20460 [Methylothermus subterraneus]
MQRTRLVEVWTGSFWGPLALMAATRFHHFGSVQTLPDASLAAFFLAGLAGSPRWGFVALVAAAGLIDWLAIRYGGVSGWCVTPAYLFLVPTYATLWLGGRLGRKLGGAGAIFGILAGSTLLAFLISNLSFYAFSGYFATTGFRTYALSILPYLGPYLLAPLVYTALILVASWAWRRLSLNAPRLQYLRRRVPLQGETGSQV